ncbi:hypothetical protein EBT25_05875, partial [bacterium]|nr:hypothetical protein [bacterium]
MKCRLKSAVLAFLLVVGIAPAAFAADIRYVDVARITWNGASAPSVSLNQIEQQIYNVVSPNWASFTSIENDERKRTISFVHGLTLEIPIHISATLNCERSDFMSYINSIRNEIYKKLGIEDWKERYLIILSPDAGCLWMGRASIGSKTSKGGVMVLHNTASGFVITHELGHSLGLGHSNLLRCSTGVADGPWSQNCKAVEYGGSIDVMGNVDTTSPPSTYHQWRMGLLESSEVKQSWLNESIELTASDVYGGTRAIFIRDGKSTYWIEYRRPRSGATYNAGLVIFRTDPPSPSFIDSPNPEDRVGFEP